MTAPTVTPESPANLAQRAMLSLQSAEVALRHAGKAGEVPLWARTERFRTSLADMLKHVAHAAVHVDDAMRLVRVLAVALARAEAAAEKEGG
jgi:hypothetical protein